MRPPFAPITFQSRAPAAANLPRDAVTSHKARNGAAQFLIDDRAPGHQGELSRVVFDEGTRFTKSAVNRLLTAPSVFTHDEFEFRAFRQTPLYPHSYPQDRCQFVRIMANARGRIIVRSCCMFNELSDSGEQRRTRQWRTGSQPSVRRY